METQVILKMKSIEINFKLGKSNGHRVQVLWSQMMKEMKTKSHNQKFKVLIIQMTVVVNLPLHWQIITKQVNNYITEGTC